MDAAVQRTEPRDRDGRTVMSEQETEVEVLGTDCTAERITYADYLNEKGAMQISVKVMPVNPKGKRGFAAMDPTKHRAISSMGGKRAHEMGTAHEFTHEEAVAAGRKGGKEVHRRGTVHRFTTKDAKAAKVETNGEGQT